MVHAISRTWLLRISSHYLLLELHPTAFLSATGARRALPGLGELLHPPVAEGQAWLGTETALARGVVRLQRAGSGSLFACHPLILSQAVPSLSLR